jgi:squalene cyclase
MAISIGARADQPSAHPSPDQEAADTVVVDEPTEHVIQNALTYLVSKQTASGSWTSTNGEFPIGITGYVVISFLANGHQPGKGPYGKNLSRAEDFLLSCVRSDGFIGGSYDTTTMYEHGIATLALAETYGQTKNENLRAKLESAVKLIVKCQNDKGGWRYKPVNDQAADISVTVVQLVALRAAKNSGLDVPQSTIDKGLAFVRTCHDSSGGFTYQPGDHQPGFARTAAAIYSMHVCGVYDDPMIAPATAYLFKAIDKDHIQWFTYGNNYAAPAMYMIGGETWKNWYGKVHAKLMKDVKKEGGTAYWYGDTGGPVYSTAIAATVLAMPYHYLPLYQR